MAQSVKSSPPELQALLQQGLALHQQGRIADAECVYLKVLGAAPENFDALHLTGVAAYQRGDPARAVELIGRAVVINSDVGDAHSNLGNAYLALKRPVDALACYERAVARSPQNPVAHNNRGIACNELGRLDDALANFDRAIALKSDYAEAHNNRGNVLNKLCRHDEAIAAFDKALALNPRYPEAWYNRAIALNDLERFEEAVAADDRALALKPRYTAAHYNRGIALHALNRFEDAIASYDHALEIEPDQPEITWNKALSLLALGRFAEGWELYEWRKKQTPPIGIRELPGPEWTGAEDIAGKTLFVYAEQGLGDTIQFARLLPLLEARGARIAFSVQDLLSALLRSLSPAIEIVDAENMPAQFDFHIALMSLPRALAIDLATIPARIPYLHAEPARISKWREIVGSEGLKIGICWQGKPGPIDRGRSFPLRHFERIARIPGVRLVNLQKFDGLEQLKDLPEGMRVENYDAQFDAGANSFLDTAALVEALDLVIAPDTAVAHLAGALAKPVFIALNHVAEWRWLAERRDSPWYPSARLFRQPQRGDWDGLFRAMEAAIVETGALKL